jgi:hypothetical protein
LGTITAAVAVLALFALGGWSPAAAAGHEVDIGIVFSDDQGCDTGSDRLVSSAVPFDVKACFTESGSPISGRDVYLEVTHGDGETERLDAVTDASGVATFTVTPTSAGVTTAQICDAEGCYDSVELESDSPPPPPVIPYVAGGGDIGQSAVLVDNPLDMIDAYTGSEAGPEESSIHSGVDIHEFSYAGIDDDGRATFKIKMVGNGEELAERDLPRWDININVTTPDGTSYSLGVRKDADGSIGGRVWDGVSEISDADVELEWSDDGSTACISASGIDVPEGSSVSVSAAASLDSESSGVRDQLSGTLVQGDGPEDGDEDGGLDVSDDSDDSGTDDGDSTTDDEGDGLPWGPIALALALTALAIGTRMNRKKGDCEPERQAVAAAQSAKDQAEAATAGPEEDLRNAKDEWLDLKATTTNPLGPTPPEGIEADWQQYEDAAKDAEGKVDGAKAKMDAATAARDASWAAFQAARRALADAQAALAACEGSAAPGLGGDGGGGAGLWLRSKNKEEDEKPKPKVRIISNGGTDSVNQYQTFRVVVEIPRDGDERPDDEIDIELSADSWDNETLTLAWDDRQHAKAPDGPAVYVSQPITLAKGAEGEGTVTVFGHEWSVGGFEGLWFTNGETVTISFGGSSTEFIAYDSWIEQGIGRCMLVIAHWKNVWTKVLADTEGQEGPEAELARANAKRGLEWAAKAEKWNERDDALQGTKLAYIEGYASNIGDFYVDLREAFTTEQGISHRGQENAHNYKAKGISDNAYQVGSALYQTVVGATIAGSAYTLGSGDTIMGQEATWDQQVLAGVEFAGWLTVASGFDARGLGDVVGGSGAKRAATDSLGDLADEVPTGPSTRPPDTFSSGWNQPTGSGPGYFNPAGTLDTITSPATGRQVDAIKLVPNTSRKDVYIHGSQPGANTPFFTDSGTPISVNRVATIVEASDWKPGIAIRLISCFSGSSGAAADLARRLKTRVLAPTHAVSIKPDGSFGFHGARKPKNPNAPNAPRGYEPPPPEAGWLEFDETGTLVGKIDQQGNWSAP